MQKRICMERRIQGAQGRRPSQFLEPHASVTYLAVCLKSVKVCPSYVQCASKSIFCCADFGSSIALDLQQKLKPFLHSSKEQMALRSFLGIYSSFVQFRSSLRYISAISCVFRRFVFWIYTFSCGTVLPNSKISSSCRCDYLYVNSFFYSDSNP